MDLGRKTNTEGDTTEQKLVEEWTTSKKVVNHKTRQVETRVQRQIVMEDGKVIADSGPQITTKTKEDSKIEESENQSKKNGDNQLGAMLGSDYIALSDSAQVINEKLETRNVTVEEKQESLQYHDESLKELTGYDVHRKAIASPNELICIDNSEQKLEPRGKLTHYSRKSQKKVDKEEVKEVSKKNWDGNVTTETTHTHHHEEIDDDEIPEDDPRVLTLPEASSEVKKEMEFLRTPVTSSRLSVKDGTKSLRSSKTIENRLLDSSSRTEEKSRMKYGGNVINIQMGDKFPDSSRLPKISRVDIKQSSSDKHESRHEHRHRQNTSSAYKTYQSNSAISNHGRRTVASSRNVAIRKEDASVQASFTSDSSEEGSSEDENEEANAQRVVYIKPQVKTFYFGENERTKTDKRSNFSDTRPSTYSRVDGFASYSPEPKSINEGLVYATVENNLMETVNDQVVNKSSVRDKFEQSYKSPAEAGRVRSNFESFIDRNKPYLAKEGILSSTGPSSLLIRSSRKDPTTRQRSVGLHLDSARPPSPDKQRTSSGTRLDTRRSPLVSRSNRMSKSLMQSKKATDSMSRSYHGTGSDFTDWPKYTPLSSPLKIQNLSHPQKSSLVAHPDDDGFY